MIRLRPIISILLPVWNDAPTLGTALNSIRRQTFQEWECVVVDDGSTDGSTEIAANFARKDSRFRLLRRDHAGLIPALNAGLDACRSPLIARMDGDDWMHRDRLAAQKQALDRAPELQAIGCFVRISPRDDLTDGRRAYERWLHSLSDPEAIWRERFIECPVAHPTLMIRRERLMALRYRDHDWPEDYDLLLRLLREGPVVGNVPRRLLGWRDLPKRLSRTDPRYALSRFTQCRAWHLHRDFLRSAPRYVLWGHGRTGRALRKSLAELGHHPSLIIEVHPRRLGNTIHGAPVVPPDALRDVRGKEMPDPIVVSVAGSNPRGEIRATLTKMGFQEGFDFVCAA